MLQRLGVSPVDVSDIAAAMESGRPVTPERHKQFLDSLVGTELIVADGILHRPLQILWRGSLFFSRTTVSYPASTSRFAHAAPERLAPIKRTSVVLTA